MWLRLRQICLVTNHLEHVVASLQSIFEVEVCHIDEAVGQYGLVNRLFPIGSQFLELVAPVEEDTAAGRYLERRKGDGGYMVITQCDDLAPRRKRAAELNIRIANELHHEGFEGMQLHPRDTGAAFFEMDCQSGDMAADGPWHPAGPDWEPYVRTHVISAIRAAELQSNDPRALAERWSAMAELDLEVHDGVFQMTLENATVRFVPPQDERGDGLVALDLAATDADAARNAARAAGALSADGDIQICGMRFNLVD